MASRHSRSPTPEDASSSRYRNIRYKSDLYVQDVPTESYTRDVADFKIVDDEHEAIVVDNGTLLFSWLNGLLTYDPGTSHLRAGFASHAKPYINEPNQAAKFTSRKSAKTALYGRDCEVDSAVRPNIKTVFDGDILMTNELLVWLHLFNLSSLH